MLDRLEATARQVAPAVQHWAVRGIAERSEKLTVRQGVAEAPRRGRDHGAMVTVIDRGGIGYAATSDTSPSGLAAAFARARDLAHAGAGRSVFDYGRLAPVAPRGRYTSRVERPASASPLKDKLDLLLQVSAATHVDARIVDWSATLWTLDTEQLLVSGDGGCAEQRFSQVIPNIQATATIG